MKLGSAKTTSWLAVWLAMFGALVYVMLPDPATGPELKVNDEPGLGSPGRREKSSPRGVSPDQWRVELDSKVGTDDAANIDPDALHDVSELPPILRKRVRNMYWSIEAAFKKQGLDVPPPESMQISITSARQLIADYGAMRQRQSVYSDMVEERVEELFRMKGPNVGQVHEDAWVKKSGDKVFGLRKFLYAKFGKSVVDDDTTYITSRRDKGRRITHYGMFPKGSDAELDLLVEALTQYFSGTVLVQTRGFMRYFTSKSGN